MTELLVQHIAPRIVRLWRPESPGARRYPDPCLTSEIRARLTSLPPMQFDRAIPKEFAPLDLRLARSDDGSVEVGGALRDGERIYGAYDADAHGLDRRGEHVHLGNELHVRGAHATVGECDRCTPHDPDADLSHTGRYGELHLPVFHSSLGYSIYVSNATAGAVLDLGDREPERWSYRAPAGEADVYVLGPGSLSDRLELYAQLTGRQPLPPVWTLGYLQSKFGYESFEEAIGIVERFDAERLPLHGLIFDVQWLEEFVNLRWDPEHFPDPGENLARIAGYGVRSIVITEPGTRSDASNYAAGAQAGHFVRDAAGGIVDSQQWYAARGFDEHIKVASVPGAFVNFFDERAADWWYSQHVPLLEQGVDAWWLDLNEPEDFQDSSVFEGVDWPERTIRLRGEQARNIYALAQQRAFMRGDLSHSDRRPFVLSRSGACGSQRYGAAPWSGDVGANWDELRVQTHLMLSAGLCGIPLWGCDVGGFHGEPSPELFTRWMQMGAFVPVFRAHGSHAAREPWAKGDAVLEHVRPALNLRAQLLPTIASWTRTALRAGLPLARPMLLDHPDDERWHDCFDQWMFGDLLVAPVLHEDQGSRQVMLPEGDWHDLWTGDRIASGPATVTVPCTLDTLPVFVRAGTALLADPEPLRRGTSWPPAELVAWAWSDEHGRARGSFSVDDGHTRAHERGEYSEFALEIDNGSLHCTAIAGNLGIPRVRIAQPNPGRLDR
jgi:alpha-glucosidase